MSNQIYRTGSRGVIVEEIQKALNNRNRLLNLPEDGNYGSRTRRAVRQFQADHWLSQDGEAGPCTMAALFNREQFVIRHNVTLCPQQDPTACWLAATSMLLNRSIPRSAVPASLLTSNGSLLNDGELNDARVTQQYARIFNLRLFYPQSWTATGLANVMVNGPVATNILWNQAGYASGAGSSGHMAVIAGIRGDGTALGTTLRIFDPWPPGVGKVMSISYQKLITNIPLATYQLYQKM